PGSWSALTMAMRPSTRNRSTRLPWICSDSGVVPPRRKDFNAMTPHDFPESDWKAFRELSALALERFCTRVLEKVEAILRDSSLGPHERYLKVFRFLRDRD